MKFKDIPLKDRPRERAWESGFENLNNSELLAIILRTGTKTKSVLELAQTIINYFQGIENLANCSLPDLIQIHGIGKNKAIELLAAFELVNRANKIRSSNQFTINNPHDTFNLLKYDLLNLKHEHFFIVLLNNKNKIINKKLIYRGTPTNIHIDPKDVYRFAIYYHAKKIICVHNHPSGECYPSPGDIKATNELVYIAKILHIEFIDHIIICNNKFYSILLQTEFKV